MNKKYLNAAIRISRRRWKRIVDAIDKNDIKYYKRFGPCGFCKYIGKLTNPTKNDLKTQSWGICSIYNLDCPVMKECHWMLENTSIDIKESIRLTNYKKAAIKLFSRFYWLEKEYLDL